MNRFQLKITPFDIEKLDYAYELAKHGHRNQTRDGGERYFEHVRSVAIILVDELGITDVEMIIAALLHDIFEDSFLLNHERIRITFGERTAFMVSSLTKPKKEDFRFRNSEERNLFYIEQIKKSSTWVKIIKLADRLHNLRTLDSCTEEKQKKIFTETKLVYIPLIKDIKKEYPKISRRIEGEINKELKKLSIVCI